VLPPWILFEIDRAIQHTIVDAKTLTCPICSATCALWDVVDFNKSCEDHKGKSLARSGVPIYYALCEGCGFCFTPEIYTWPLEKFKSAIYNDDYVLVDPEYLDVRPRTMFEVLRSTYFPALPPSVRHLDYGGGNGRLAQLLRQSGWQSTSYDPVADEHVDPQQLGKFDLITAFEVFEHVPDTSKLMSDLSSLLSDDSLILFTTFLSDGNIDPNRRLDWWYASPRNGHISLFSKKSLAVLAQRYGFLFGSFNSSWHVFLKKVPPWAEGIMKIG
jgi:SAM-dependent methyltransferase